MCVCVCVNTRLMYFLKVCFLSFFALSMKVFIMQGKLHVIVVLNGISLESDLKI